MRKLTTAIMKLLGIQREYPQLLLMQVVKEYVVKYTIENDIGPETRARYEVYMRNIHFYLASQKLQEISLQEIRIRHAEDLRVWLRLNLKTCSVRHASRHVELLKRVTNYAVRMEYAVNDYLSPVRSQRDKPKDIIHLEQNELKKLMLYKFHNDIIQIAADLFIFQCFTGFSYSDLYSFSVVQKENAEWLFSKRHKTGESEYIFFFPEAKDILHRYEGRFPIMSNQSYNRYLKEIAAIVNINKKLTTHVGRKTHATILDERGVSLSTIARQLRNTHNVCEQYYVAKSHLRTDEEIKRLGLDTGMMAQTNFAV